MIRNTSERAESLTFEEFERIEHWIYDESGKKIKIPLRKGKNNGAIIDQITFSFSRGSFMGETEEQHTAEISHMLEDILGLSITGRAKYGSKMFYTSCYSIGESEYNFGTLHIGGERQCDKATIELTSLGCNLSKLNWESRLYDYLSTELYSPKITRCDIAFDFLEGGYSPSQALKDHDRGGFSFTNRIPKSSCAGTDWRSKDGSGKTFYIGTRNSSKYTRIYEKGKQLGDKQSKWTRFEIEFKSRDIIIPFEVLKNPGIYLAGAYPICEKLFNTEKRRRIEIIEKTKDLSEAKAIHYGRLQIGKLINYLVYKGYSSDEIIDLLRDKTNELPKRLRPKNFKIKE